MSEYRRCCDEGGTFFFTLVTFERAAFLTSNEARRCLRAAWKETQCAHPFQVDAVCLLPDHLHCVWTLPEGDTDYSSRWKQLKGAFTRSYLAGGGSDGFRNASRLRSREAAVWQRRFWEHRIRDGEDYRRHVEYIHYNPVKHGHVSKPIDWAWSSLHRFVRQGLHEKDWGSQEPPRLKDFDRE